MPYKFLENVAIADVAFEVRAQTINGLFEDCARAMTNVMIRDLSDLSQKVVRKFSMVAVNIENLLFNFLNELVYYKDVDFLLFGKFKVNIRKKEDGFEMKCIAYGDKIDPKKLKPVVDVKAVTMHMFEVKKTQRGWWARIVLDI